MREYVLATTPANILDWQTGSNATFSPYAGISVSTLVVRGERGHPSMARVAEILGATMPDASLATVAGAGHFMIATHAGDVARLIAGMVSGTWRATHEDRSWEA
jgi:pimeloyl-ACP methyl ester carboxylesterase